MHPAPTSLLAPAAAHPPEVALLVALARTRLDSETHARVARTVQSGFDAHALVALAERHRVTPLVQRHLARWPGFVADIVLQRLHDRCREIASLNLALIDELDHVLAGFDAAGVIAVPYKGPALAAASYGDLTVREFLDLDLLVQKPDVPSARRFLDQRGYRPVGSFRSTARSWQDVFVHPDLGIGVKLRWAPMPQYLALPIEGRCWLRLSTIRLGGRDVPCLSQEDLLLVLCAHGTRRCWERLALVCDVAETLRAHPDIDWDSVLDRAEALKARHTLALGLRLAEGVLDVPLPEQARRWTAAAGVESTSRRLAAYLLDPEPRPMSRLGRTLVHLGSRDTWRHRWRYLTLRAGELGVRVPRFA